VSDCTNTPAIMKFGRNLPRNQVPEWASSYINYKGLKKLIKSAAEASKNGEDADLAGEYPISFCRKGRMLICLQVSFIPLIETWRM
jgi:hypothetical protein